LKQPGFVHKILSNEHGKQNRLGAVNGTGTIKPRETCMPNVLPGTMECSSFFFRRWIRRKQHVCARVNNRGKSNHMQQLRPQGHSLITFKKKFAFFTLKKKLYRLSVR